MAYVLQTIENGPRNVVLKVTGAADDAGGTIDISSYDVPGYTATDWNLKRVQGGSDQKISIEWDAISNMLAWEVAVGENTDHDFNKAGGIPNNAGAGKTGDVVITPAAAADYSLMLSFTKRYT